MAIIATVVADYRGGEVTLKRYNDYHEFDKDFSTLASIKDLEGSLGLEKDKEDLYVYDKDGKTIPIRPNILTRTTLAYFDSKKGDEFVRWIFNPIANGLRADEIKTLQSYFLEKQALFASYTRDDMYGTPAFKAESARLLAAVEKIVGALYAMSQPYATLEYYSQYLHDAMEEYVKKDGKYSYRDMRELVRELAQRGFKFREAKDVTIEPISEQQQDELIERYIELIKSKTFQGKTTEPAEINYEEAGADSYDENGEKINEIPFHQDFIEQKEAGNPEHKKILRG